MASWTDVVAALGCTQAVAMQTGEHFLARFDAPALAFVAHQHTVTTTRPLLDECVATAAAQRHALLIAATRCRVARPARLWSRHA
eukprot:5562333-Prymnesium_polylepis.1